MAISIDMMNYESFGTFAINIRCYKVCSAKIFTIVIYLYAFIVAYNS